CRGRSSSASGAGFARRRDIRKHRPLKRLSWKLRGAGRVERRIARVYS
ncbi:MAG: hypothetical protein AVDCRST_MAG89-188, partial [uncultured Gemmatimonadetes bacterium]